MNPQLESRLKSFAWRTMWLLLASLFVFVQDPAVLQQLRQVLPGWAWAMPIIVNIAGELSKWLNNKAQERSGEREPTV